MGASDEKPKGEKTDEVRRLAQRYGVSERTVWRHLAAGTLDRLIQPGRNRDCDYCGRLFWAMTAWQRFCCETHRVYHHRHGPRPTEPPAAAPGLA